ncbi:MAG: IS1634 family transposase [Planctomycetes bacterium]|nr:IS1634 family transposase [Planctomycetota bacterium]
MATIQAKTSRGHKYWYIVESRRVNGKPRPVVLAYLGKPEDLLRRLQGQLGPLAVKSYAHGAVAALLKLVADLQIVELINGYVKAQRPYFAEKPLRHGLTVGMTLVLAAIGRACRPTSKQGWWEWAKTTSCEFLLRVALSPLDSQHFWDLMDSLPEDAIPRLEMDLLQRIQQRYRLDSDTLALDTTNFFTFIATTNVRCSLAQRTRSKQKRHDLRHIGLALVVTRQDLMPLFHLTYQGNLHDVTVFAHITAQIATRLRQLGMDPERHTLVFDRGNNSRDNLHRLQRHQLHYVGALRPCDHRQLVADAEKHFTAIDLDGTPVQVYRDQRLLWGAQRTLVVFISHRLKSGQLRGIYQELERKKTRLRQLQRQLANPRARPRRRDQLEAQIADLLKGQYMTGLLHTTLDEHQPGRFSLRFRTQRTALDHIEDQLGFRILMTDRHDWSTEDIIHAYHAQASVEHTFRHLKDPHHLAIRPQFHWTDQKLHVHFFTCVLGYQLAALLRHTARHAGVFTGTAGSLLRRLARIRLTTFLEATGQRGRPKATHQLETMEADDEALAQALGITDIHHHRPDIRGVGVYA